MTTAEIPPLTCPNGSEQRFVRARIGVTTRVVRACVNTPDPATPDEPGDDDAER